LVHHLTSRIYNVITHKYHKIINLESWNPWERLMSSINLY